MIAINLLLIGKQSWPRDIIDELMQSKKVTKLVRPNIHLTARQQQVMDLVCHRGLPNKTIANMLKITESTVKIHVSAILKEYGVRNRTQLALASQDALQA
jgi:DNA-binding NarL/FixJ family response regulator